MNFGVVYPQTELEHDPVAIRDYAQAAEGLGFSHILAYEHVLGANPDRPGGWQGPYTHQHAFMEPFVLFSFLAGQTQKIGFATGILILPQRQTVLAAKQAACLDVLCGGRLRLGVGLGWNEVEFTALNQEFHNRGRRIEEQIEVMRLLWMHPLVDYHGKWHEIPDAGLNPMPRSALDTGMVWWSCRSGIEAGSTNGRWLDAKLPCSRRCRSGIGKDRPSIWQAQGGQGLTRIDRERPNLVSKRAFLMVMAIPMCGKRS